MNRREALQRTAQVMGVALSSSAFAGIMAGCTPSREINWTPRFLTKEQSLIAGSVAEQIIPRTETVGALDVGVDEFIDLMLFDNYTLKQQRTFSSGLNDLDGKAHELFGETFVECTAENKNQLLTDLESNVDYAGSDQREPFWLMIKELTLLGYFTSKEGLTQNLEHIPIPGSLQGCIAVQPGQKLKVGNHV